MRKIILATLVALFACTTTAPAADRSIAYPGQQPSSMQVNLQARFARLAIGTWIRDALGSDVTASGIYANLSIVPNGGMTVVVEPSTTNTLGSLYQVAVSDTAALPAGIYTPQLSADPTKIVVQGLIAAPSGSLGPVTAPSSGLSQYILVEAQAQTTDTTPTSFTFLDSSGHASSSTVPAVRHDAIALQLKLGTAASSPTQPTVDTGWIAIGYILVPSGTSTITSGMISAAPAFNGFVSNGAQVSISGLRVIGQPAGCAQFDSLGNVTSLPCTSGLGSVTATSPLTASTVSGVANVACTICVTSVSGSSPILSTGGSAPTISLGIVPRANGGTGQNSLPTGALFFDGTNIVTGTTLTGLTAGTGISVGTGATPTVGLSHGDYVDLVSGQTVAGLKTFSTVPIFSGPLGTASGGLGLASYTTGDLVFASSSSVLAKLADVATGNVLRSGGVGVAPAWGKVSLGTDVTGTAGITNGGTGQTSLPTGVLQYNGSSIVAAPAFVDLTSTQSIGGAKTFTSAVTGSSSFAAGGSALCAGNSFCTGTAGTGSANAYFFGNAVSSGSCSAQKTGIYGSGSVTVQGVSAAVLGVSCFGGVDALAIDGSGNAGLAGNLTATNFFNGSKRAWKKNIVPLSIDGLGVLKATNFASYECADVRCGPIGTKKIGFIADDTPAVLSGASHDHFDAAALATVDARAILQISHRLDGLEAMVKRLCAEKKNRKDPACVRYAH